MSELPPSSSSAHPFSEMPPEDILNAGISSLKGKDFAAAIESFSTLAQNATIPSAIRLKARMGWVSALRGTGQLQEAIALCQPLTQHPQVKVQQWAKATLDKLTPPTLNIANDVSQNQDLSGFQPLNPTSPPPQATGFVPLDESTSGEPGATVDNISGFQPSTAADSRPSTARPPEWTETPNDSDSSLLPLPDATPIPRSNDPSPAAESPVAPENSLFHYTNLNQAGVSTVPGTDSGDRPQPVAEQSVSEHPIAEHPISEQSALPPAEEVNETPWVFTYGGRLPRLRAIPYAQWKLFRLWGVQALTAIALFWACRAFVQVTLTQVAKLLGLFQWLLPIPLSWRYQKHTMLVLVILGMLLLASPWLLDLLLTHVYGQRNLTIQKLKQTHPEGCRLLRRIGQQRSWTLPALRELPLDAPLIFSYGWLPRYSRIVVSRGALARLHDDELATLIGYELTHLTTWTLPLMSLIAVLIQLLYLAYWQVAQLGDRAQDRASKTVAAGLSALCYGLYWVVHKLSLALSRLRVASCDRQATEWTGNPNALARAIIKLGDGIAQTLRSAAATPPIIESTALLTPCGYDTAIALSTIYPHPAFPTLLQWDTRNPYRYWLSCNSTHPLLGERLRHLTIWALHWRLEPEVSLPEPAVKVSFKSQADFWAYWVPLLRQASPYAGPILGIIVALLFWFVGGLVNPLDVWQLSWFYGDRSLVRSGLFLGTGIGIMLRINRYFPDITALNRLPAPSLPSLWKNSMALPTDSQPMRLQGTLLGRRGMANWLCQDLLLETPAGLLKVHFLSSLGAVGNLLLHPQHPTDWLNHKLEIQGWFRRGAIVWLDIDYCLQKGKTVARANHPIWSVLLSLVFCGWGIYILVRG